MTKAELARRLAWRFKVIQQAGERPRNIARTCRHLASLGWAFYRWKRRFDAHGSAGLSDRPSTPHRSPKATSREVVSKILYLRQTYHFGPGKIADRSPKAPPQGGAERSEAPGRDRARRHNHAASAAARTFLK